MSDLVAKAEAAASRAYAPYSNYLVGAVVRARDGREFIGVKTAAALIKSLRETYDYPIFLNADHTHSLDKAKEACASSSVAAPNKKGKR